MSDPKWLDLPPDKRKEISILAQRLNRTTFTLMVEDQADHLDLCVVKYLENDPLLRITLNQPVDLEDTAAAVYAYVLHVWNSREIWELPLGDPDDPINIDKVRSPIQLLMQYDNFRADVEYCEEGYGDDRYCEQDMAFDDGSATAMKFALKVTQSEIDGAAHDQSYVSWGDDTRDYWESGWDRGVHWCAGFFEWDAEGNVIEESLKE